MAYEWDGLRQEEELEELDDGMYVIGLLFAALSGAITASLVWVLVLLVRVN